MKYILRLLIYFTGLFLLAIGINLAIKSNLGVSPVSSLPLVLSKIIGKSLGTVTTVVYVFYVLAQAIILGKKFKLKNLLQLLFGSVFGFFVNFAGFLLIGIEANSYFIQLILMMVSILIISLGIIMFISMDIVPNAPDGLVLAISARSKVGFGKVKVIFDCASVIVTIGLSLLFLGNISGIREGTIISAVLTGKVIGVISKPLTPRLKKVVNLSVK